MYQGGEGSRKVDAPVQLQRRLSSGVEYNDLGALAVNSGWISKP